MDYVAMIFIGFFGTMSAIAPPSKPVKTELNFFQCLPKWQEGKGMVRHEECNRASNDGVKNDQEKGR